MTESSITCCTCFINIVLPSQAELLLFDSDKAKKFYGVFTGATIPIIEKYDGKIRKFVGEGLEAYFPRTVEHHNFGAIKNVLDCCIALIEKQKSFVENIQDIGLSDAAYKIAVDYETIVLSGDLILDKPAVWSSSYEISTKTPPDGIFAGEDFVKVVSNLQELRSRYYFEKIGEYFIEEKMNEYKVFILNRQV